MKSQLGALRWATGTAAVLSMATIVLALTAIPIICSQVWEVRQQLAAEMAEYRGLSDALWTDLVRLGGSGGADTAHRRQAREAYGQAYDSAQHEEADGYGAQEEAAADPPMEPMEAPLEPEMEQEELILQPKCHCQGPEDNKCPPGPPGPKGAPGARGIDGDNGAAGQDGMDAGDLQEQAQMFGECWRCPAGPPGIPGAPGSTGARGMRGARGKAGCAGRNGAPGPSGMPGDIGPPGVPGKSGPQGDVGAPGNAYKALPGVKGLPGPIGEEGDTGRPGIDGEDGEIGEGGPVGPPGPPGEPGMPGDEGTEGKSGKHGNDARYCPCPQRSRFLGAAEEDGYGDQAPAIAPPPASEIDINQGYGAESAARADHHEAEETSEAAGNYGQAPMLEPAKPEEHNEIAGRKTVVSSDGYGAEEAPEPAPLPAPAADDSYGSPPAASPPASSVSFVAVEDRPGYGAADLGTPELEKRTLNKAKVISRGGKPHHRRRSMIPISRMGYGRYRNRKV